MFKSKILAVGLLLTAMAMPCWAEESEPAQAGAAQPAYNMVYEMGKNLPTDVLVGEVKAEDMEKKLYGLDMDGLLYMKDEEGKIIAFSDLDNDRASCRQILYAAPNDTMLQFYSNNKKAFNQMYKAIRSHMGIWHSIDGYVVVGDKHPVLKLENDKKVYTMWLKKVKSENKAVRVVAPYYPDYDYPIHLGLYGWGWYHHHHHYHPGHHYHPAPHPRPFVGEPGHHPGPGSIGRPAPRPFSGGIGRPAPRLGGGGPRIASRSVPRSMPRSAPRVSSGVSRSSTPYYQTVGPMSGMSRGGHVGGHMSGMSRGGHMGGARMGGHMGGYMGGRGRR